MRKPELDRLREEGLRRYRIIAPLLEEGLAESEKRSIRRLIRSQEGISGRTLRRYVAAFKRGGFEALLPGERKDKGTCKAIPAEALQMAAELRRELPARSAERIQQLLASEGYRVARSTLERHLRRQGLSGREIKAEQKQVASRRFNRKGRNTLWQADLKYGPYCLTPTIRAVGCGPIWQLLSMMPPGWWYTASFMITRNCRCWRTLCARPS